jgi:hypothetical protein
METEFQVLEKQPLPLSSFFLVVFQDAAALFQETWMDFFVCFHVGEEKFFSFSASC